MPVLESISSLQKNILIFLVDDHPILLRGLEMTISNQPEMEICGSAETINEALDKLESVNADILIADIKLKDESGIQLINKIRIKKPNIKILMMSMHDEIYFIEKSLQAGANGYLLKSEPTTYLIEAIQSIHTGKNYLSPKVEAKLFKQILNPRDKDVSAVNIDCLSEREQEIFLMIGYGKTSKDIADHLNISIRTVDTHKINIKKKLNKTSMNEVLKAAIEWSKLKLDKL